MISKALILAAGRGTRMGSLTVDLPKPMLPLKGRPILDHLIERMTAAGLREFGVVIGYRAEAVERHFAGRAEISFFRQETIDGTARAALLGREWVGGEAFLFTFGDILTESRDYRAMIDLLDLGYDAVAAVREVDDPWAGAAVYEAGGVVARIVEKPPKGTSATRWGSAGVYCFRADVFEELARVPLSTRGEYELTSAVEALVAKGRVAIHPLTGVWRDIGRPEDWEAAQSEV
ncbi:MAG: nucleotidyltransferase family protein [Bryobacteraceae bacterium]|nr:nucleotidyltransferase family protein [Bryobacteraceae bacterium]